MMNFSIKQQESDILPGLYISGNKEPENKRTKQSVLDFISEVDFSFTVKSTIILVFLKVLLVSYLMCGVLVYSIIIIYGEF